MIRPGLCSITFRAFSPREVTTLVAKARLAGIEWGGDVHVPPGNRRLAREVREMTLAEGLAVSSYGSYYRAGIVPQTGPSFEHVLESAVELGAPVIRIWAGNKNYDDATPEEIQAVADDLRRIAGLAQAAGVTLACEFHEGTLTQRSETTLVLAEKVAAVSFYWQSPFGATTEASLAGLKSLLPRLRNLHVFHWSIDSESQPRRLVRHSLEEGAAAWQLYLRAAASLPGEPWALLEFVKDDDPAQFLRDAETLKRLLTACSH